MSNSGGSLEGDLYAHARGVMADTAAAVDALSAFMQARAALEESHSKALARLSKSSLNVSGARLCSPARLPSLPWRARAPRSGAARRAAKRTDAPPSFTRSRRACTRHDRTMPPPPPLPSHPFLRAESSLHPALFEALASLRGDVVNESVQHRELASAIAKDVIEPLASLRESADMVVRVVRGRRRRVGPALWQRWPGSARIPPAPPRRRLTAAASPPPHVRPPPPLPDGRG